MVDNSNNNINSHVNSFEFENGKNCVKVNRNGNYVQRNKNGEDEILEFLGFKRNSLRTVLTWFSYILTLGLVRLFYHWYPKFKLYATHDKCPLNWAEKILITEIYKEKSKAYFVKCVKMIIAGPNSGEKLNYNLENGSSKEHSKIRLFRFKKVAYVWDDEKAIFLKLAGMEIGKTNLDFHQMDGINDTQSNSKLKMYGNNEIDVPQYSTLKLFALEALTPFYIFQVFSLIIWMAEYYYYYGIAIVAMSVLGIGSSVYQTRKNQRNLKGTVNKSDIVNVKRNGIFREISTTLLVPGDVIEIPPNGCRMYCDAILLNGNCIVNESSLTGESVPVLKTALPTSTAIFDIMANGNHVLYCGTAIIQTRYYGAGTVTAVVLRTGWLTTKGELVTSIMYPPPADFKFDQDSYKYILILTFVSILGVIYTIVSKSTRGLSAYDVIIKALDLITIVIPPALPAAMTVGKLFALKRLEKLRIFCINSRVVNVAGSIDCVCFDKTGTLTEDGLDMWGVIRVECGKLCESQVTVDSDSQLLMGMVTCHSLTLIEGKLEGDPLDLKMFESTKWILEEPNVPDTTKYDLFVPTIVKPAENSTIEMGILRQFQFSSSLQRMSVISKTLRADTFHVYCKGAPETIVSLCRAETVPADIMDQLGVYTCRGYRVIAIAGRALGAHVNLVRVQRMVREDAEHALELYGLIVFENRLKGDTSETIAVLKEARIKIVMITGDNVQTAVSVAKECGIIGADKDLVFVNRGADGKEPRLYYEIVRGLQNINQTTTSRTFDNPTDVSPPPTVHETNRIDIDDNEQQYQSNGDGEIEYGGGGGMDVQVAMTGATWAHVRRVCTQEERGRIVARGVVFARMTSEQKQQLVQELQALGHYVAMCGDGTNDCGALKAAHVGISLSEAEASIASPFTAQPPNITCVPNIIIEGRAALVTSYGVFKYMICYSLTEFISCLILYGIDSNLTSFQFLYIDLLLIVQFTATFGLTGSAHRPGGRLSKRPPTAALLSCIPLTSITLQLVCVCAFQTTAYYAVRTYDWYVPFTYVPDSLVYTCYENYAVFSVSMFQYIMLAVIFSKGRPYRQPIYTNVYLSGSIVVMVGVCLYVAVEPAGWMRGVLEMVVAPTYDGRLMVVGVAVCYCGVAWVMEDVFVEVLLRGRCVARGDKVGAQDGGLILNGGRVGYTHMSYESDSQLTKL